MSREPFSGWAVGDRVKHYGTRQWGTILEVVWQRSWKSPELKIRREDGTEGYWAGYHVGEHTPGEGVVIPRPAEWS